MNAKMINFSLHIFFKPFHTRLAAKIFEDFGGVLCKEFIKGWEPVSYQSSTTLVHNRPAHPKLISYTITCKLACCLGKASKKQ